MLASTQLTGMRIEGMSCRFPPSRRELHGNAGAASAIGWGSDADEHERVGSSRALPHLHRTGYARTNLAGSPRVQRRTKRVPRRRTAPRRSRILDFRFPLPDLPIPNAPPDNRRDLAGMTIRRGADTRATRFHANGNGDCSNRERGMVASN